jgi:hypothetical protein
MPLDNRTYISVQRQRDSHARSRAGRVDGHVTTYRFQGEAHEPKPHPRMPAVGGCFNIETRPVVGHFELNLVAGSWMAHAPQPNSDSGRSGKFVDIAQELLRRPVQQRRGLPIDFHAVVRCFQVHHDSAFAQRKGQSVNRPRDAKRKEIDRMRISKNASDCDNLVA